MQVRKFELEVNLLVSSANAPVPERRCSSGATLGKTAGNIVHCADLFGFCVSSHCHILRQFEDAVGVFASPRFYIIFVLN